MFFFWIIGPLLLILLLVNILVIVLKPKAQAKLISKKNRPNIPLVYIVITVVGLISSYFVFRFLSYDSLENFTTPELKGRIIDSSTNEPLVDAKVIAYWSEEFVYFTDQVETYKYETYTSDKYGNFTIPSFSEKSPYGPNSKSKKLVIVAYSHGYESYNFIMDDFDDKGNLNNGSEKIDISLTPIASASAGIDSCDDLKRFIGLYGGEEFVDPKFVAEEYNIIFEKFPEDPLAPVALLNSAYIYKEKMGQHPEYKDLAIEQYEKVIENFPDSEDAEKAKKYISEIE